MNEQHKNETRNKMTEPVLSIRKWDPRTMAPDATCLAVGKRHAGKSTLMTDVMWHLRDRLDLVIGMNPTENSTNPTLGKFLPPAFIYDRYDEEKVKHVLEWQRRTVANGKGMRVGLILDDCMGETNTDGSKKKIMSSGEIGKIFKIGRHRKLLFWCTLQYMRDCPPDARSNTDLRCTGGIRAHCTDVRNSRAHAFGAATAIIGFVCSSHVTL